MADPNTPDTVTALHRWQEANAQLYQIEQQLATALLEAARSRSDAPRDLVIAAERKRAEVGALFQVALDLLDSQSPVRTGMTGFGTL